MSEEALDIASEQEIAVRHRESADCSNRKRDTEVPIVAIGASAGGLESIERFFQNIEEKPGAAFIIVQHLSPDFKSFMPQILSKKTRLQVLTVTDQMPVHPDIIYLVPPRMNLVIENNILYLTDIQRTRVPNKPINRFFESLALDSGNKATAVVLSGTGSDGAEGIVRIHNAGGKVYVESPASAKYDGMPGAAIAKRIHDGEGTPFEIAGEIFGKNIVDLHSSTLVLKKALAGSAERVHIFKAIENRYGVDFARYKIATVNRRIDRRMTELNLTGIGNYWNYIQENETEVTTLYYEMLIGVTNFFRDPEAFELIESQIAGIVQEKRSGEEVRVWSAGCASGEETYSLAILFSEEIKRSGKTLNLKVFATDIDDEILGSAAAGKYGKEQLCDMPERYRNQYFAEKSDVYKVNTELRSKIVFARHNIMNDPPFTKLDMIACRNLLIYLDDETQRQVLSLFYFSLNPSGTLFLGPSESLGKYEAGYSAIDTKWKIFSKSTDTLPAVSKLKPTSQRNKADFPVILNTTRRPASFAGNTTVRSSADGVYLGLLDQYVPPGLLIDERQELLHVYGKLPFPVSFNPGKMSSSLRSFLDESLCTAISVCVQRVKREKTPVEYSNFVIHDEEEDKALDFKVLPVAQPGSDHVTNFLVTFGGGFRNLDDTEARTVIENSVNLEQVSALQQELKNTKQHLQATVEELESTNEELQSTNEELLASNEELQSTNEEVHSVNEELYTVNAEYQTKITELNQLSIDEEHLFSSTGVGTIFIDQERQIRKFTPAAAELFNLMSQDQGRPFDHVTHQFEGVNFNLLVEQCIGSQENVESEVQTRNGEPYLVKIVPYCNDRDQIDGVVVSFVSVQAVKQAEQQYRDMFQSSPVGIAGIKPDHSIESANASLVKLLGYSVDELLGQSFTKLFPQSEESTAAGVIEAYVDGASDKNNSEQVASTVLTRDGKKVPVEISVNSVPTADGVRIHLYVTDMTNRQNLLDSAEFHRDEFEAMVEVRATELDVRTREYEDLYENAPNMYASIDPESATITKCNNRLALITGYDKSELIGMKVFNLYHPDSHLDTQVAFKQFVAAGNVKSRHLQLRLKSGERLHVLLNVDAVRDEEGNILESRSTWVDISDVHMLREENRTFLLATKGSDIGIWDWDFATGDQNWSDKFHELLGYSEASTADLSFEMPDIIHSDDQEALTKLFKSHFSGKSTFDIESRLKTLSGEYLWFRLQGRAVRGTSGKVERMVGSAQNVHAAREAKEELNRQAEIHRFITHETNDGWWDWHTQDDYEYMSPRFWETFGIDPSTRSNSPSEWKDVIHPDDLVLSMQNFKNHAESGGDSPYAQEVRYRHADGHWVTVICRGRVVEWDAKGQPARMVGVHTDITRLKQQEYQLKEINGQLAKSNEDLERFAYITSHDLKAPLRGISTLVGFMEEDLSGVLDDDSEEADSIKGNLARLARQATRMEGLISGVLDYSRVESAGAGVERISVGELLADLAIDHQLDVGRQFILPDNLPSIKADPVMFEQVFGNLMSNAAKFHPYPEELKIVVGCEQAGENYVFSVQDNGLGIHPKYHDRIFDMFQTLQSRDTYESTGIGLTLVKRIVEKFGGKIWIESQEGEGAKFLFSWPAVVGMPAI